MKAKNKLSLSLSILLMSLFVVFSTGCNKDDGEKISAEQIGQALFDMKGNYYGTIKASFYQGAEIAKIDNTETISRESLTFVMPLEPIASTITDEKVATILRTIGKVEVKAEYHFDRIDDYGNTTFLLTPQKVVIPSNGDVADVTIVLADWFGGNFHNALNSIVFNISPKEILVGDVKLASFKQLVYHFEGKYE